MKSRYSASILTPKFFAVLIGVVLLASCNEVTDVYTPSEWVTMLKKAGGWAPLPFPYSKYRPGSIIKARKNVPCDWPYAARRYNGPGINSYHYQTIVLRNILTL
jgi:hypothetical protein